MPMKIRTNFLPPEWAPQDAVLIAWPHPATDWCGNMGEVEECYQRIAQRILETEDLIVVAPNANAAKARLFPVAGHRIVFCEMPTNDTWTRDFGPITTVTEGKCIAHDYCFNAWGLKFAANKDNLVNRRLAQSGLFAHPLCDEQDFVLEGGSIESDGQGTLLTTTSCLLSSNRNRRGDTRMRKETVEARLKRDLGARQVLWIENGEILGDDTDGHIDTLARFAPNNVIAYCGPGEEIDAQHESLLAMKHQLDTFCNAAGEPYSLVELPLPDPIYDADGSRMPATYANFLILNGQVLVPIYRQQENDGKALSIISDLFPDRKVTGIDCIPLIRQHGSLHCVTMQFPEHTIIIK